MEASAGTSANLATRRHFSTSILEFANLRNARFQRGTSYGNDPEPCKGRGPNPPCQRRSSGCNAIGRYRLRNSGLLREQVLRRGTRYIHVRIFGGFQRERQQERKDNGSRPVERPP